MNFFADSRARYDILPIQNNYDDDVRCASTANQFNFSKRFVKCHFEFVKYILI